MWCHETALSILNISKIVDRWSSIICFQIYGLQIYGFKFDKGKIRV